jgi:hypothetical protein
MAAVRFFRRVQIAPGVRLNLARQGASLSFGVRGAHLTVGRRGLRRTLGVPGSGVFYTSTRGWHSGCHTGVQFAPAPAPVRAARAPQPAPGGSWWKVVLIALGLIALAAIGQTFGR